MRKHPNVKVFLLSVLGVLVLLTLVNIVFPSLLHYGYEPLSYWNGLGSPAKYNGFLETAWPASIFGLMIVSVYTRVTKQTLSKTIPWAVAALTGLYGLFVGGFYKPYYDNIDPSLSSVFPYLFYALLPVIIVFAIARGAASLMSFRISKKL